MHTKKSSLNLNIRYASLQGIYWMCFCAICSFATVFLLSKDFANKQIGIMIAIANVVATLLQTNLASFLDKRVELQTRKIVALLEGIALLLIIALVVIPHTTLLLIILYPLITIITISILPLLSSMSMDYINIGVPINYGLARGIGSLSFAVVSFFLGVLVEKNGTNIMPITFLILYIILIGATTTFKGPDRQQISNDSTGELLTTNELAKKQSPVGFFIQYKKFTILLIASTFLFACHNAINSYMINIVENVGGDSSHMGKAIAIAAISEFPVMMAYVYMRKRIPSSFWIKFSGVFFTIKAVITLLATNMTGIYIAQLTQMLAFSIFLTGTIYYANEIMDVRDKMKGQALLTTTITIGGVVGSLLGGALLDAFSVKQMLFVFTILSALGSLITFFSTEKSMKS